METRAKELYNLLHSGGESGMVKFVYMPARYPGEVGKIRIFDKSVKGFFARYSLRVMREAHGYGKAWFIRFKGEDASDE